MKLLTNKLYSWSQSFQEASFYSQLLQQLPALIMKREQVAIQSIREDLVKQQLGGHLLGDDTISELYGKVSSVNGQFVSSSAGDWATISYVQTDSAHGSGGMPDWVAHEAEQVLDALLAAKIVGSRAVWFDRLGMKQFKDWPAIATLQCLAAPVVCIPPTRTLEYSRFQLPDRWDTATFDFFTTVEDLLRSCSICGPKCPLEYDSRLLCVAAALRAWPTNEAIMASSSRGAFISFATLDRIQYTMEWYQVLLQLALDLGEYGSEMHARSIELYGSALFHPCSHCLAMVKEYNMRRNKRINCQLLDDTLAALLQQVHRFCLPWANSHEGLELWSLHGLQRSPGEYYMRSIDNDRRLSIVQRRKFLSQSRLDEIAANIIRGRPALLSCARHGDKWLCGLILSNLDRFLRIFRSELEDFDEKLRNQILRLLKLERPFGELCSQDSWMDAGGNRSVRSPHCDGQQGDICFFNELSGVLDPSAVGQFISDRGLTLQERVDILTSAEQSLRRRIHAHGVAFLCYELKRKALWHSYTGKCGGCVKANPDSNNFKQKMILIGWRAKDDLLTTTASTSRESQEEMTYSFITVDVDDQGHVHSRGTFHRSKAIACSNCRSLYVPVEIEDSNDLLEVHISKRLPIARALSLVYQSFKRYHMA